MSIVSHLHELINAESCHRLVHSLRWLGRELRCPRCQSGEVRPWGAYHRRPGLKRYWCVDCGRTFNDLTGTLLDKSKVSPRRLVVMTFLLCLACSSRRIAREVGCHVRTSYRWCWWLRNAALSYEQATPREGTIEADEIYVTAGCKGQAVGGGTKELGREPRKRGKKQGRGRGHFNKDAPCVIAWVARTGKVLLHVTKDFTQRTVQQAASRAVQLGSRLYTDAAKSYQTIQGVIHEFVNHSQREYARDDVHENRAENLFSLLRPFLAAFRGVAKKNLVGYIAFFQFLRNFRKLNAFEQAKHILAAALDPAIATQARKQEFVQAFDQFGLLHTVIN